MKKKFLMLALIISLCSSCKKETDPFLITKHNIGFLTDSTQVKDLNSIFQNDSIYRYIGGDEFTGNKNDIEIYEKGGNPLMVLSPSEALDSTSTIRNIKVIDARYQTSSGLHANSTFKDIKDRHKISGIQNTLRNVIVSVDEINAYFTIDKNELPADMRFDMSLKIETIQIPEAAQIKDFFLYWSNN